MRQFLFKFLYVLKGKRKQLILLLFLFLFTSFTEVIGIGLVGPFMALATSPESLTQNYWLQLIYTNLSLRSGNELLILMGLGLVVIFYLKSFLSFRAQRYIFEFGFKQQAELSTRLMHAYLNAPYTFHLGKNSSILIQNIINESRNFANNIMMPLLTLISNAIVILALLILLLKTNLLATVIIGGLGPIAFLAYHLLKVKLGHWGKEGSDSYTEMIRVINHGLGGIKETKIIGCEPYFELQLQKQAERFGKSAGLANSFLVLPRYLIEAFLITFLIIFTFVFLAVNQDQNLSSVLGIFALASIRLLPTIGNFLSSVNGIRYNSISLERIYFDLKELEKLAVAEASSSLSYDKICDRNEDLHFDDQIDIKGISFHYLGASKNALNEISLTIKKGQSIGLIGKSGSGKTTLVDVLLGLLTPQSGDIFVDNISIYTDLRRWQNLIGYVPQSIFLIDDTLERNIAFGVPNREIDRESLHQAVKSAQLLELVDELPEGLQTMVGERGVLLSGGQRQRVGIARALYHKREILVFDEATAALDNETEAFVTDAIKSLSGIKTMIIIAHRLSTIEHCDQIYMLKKGQIIKSGTYQEVVL
jgi:ABC-type multidrug transport system fused ATPase/permease subunit